MDNGQRCCGGSWHNNGPRTLVSFGLEIFRWRAALQTIVKMVDICPPVPKNIFFEKFFETHHAIPYRGRHITQHTHLVLPTMGLYL